jgi:hypothetical protein
MPHDAPLYFRDEGKRECLGVPQRGNDELLRVSADGQLLERCGGNLGNGADIGARFTSDDDFGFHVSGFLAWLASRELGQKGRLSTPELPTDLACLRSLW